MATIKLRAGTRTTALYQVCKHCGKAMMHGTITLVPFDKKAKRLSIGLVCFRSEIDGQLLMGCSVQEGIVQCQTRQ